MYKDVEITILESKALLDIRKIHKDDIKSIYDKYTGVDDILNQLDKDIYKLTRKKKKDE